jgi:hypothetical protein
VLQQGGTWLHPDRPSPLVLALHRCRGHNTSMGILTYPKLVLLANSPVRWGALC